MSKQLSREQKTALRDISGPWTGLMSVKSSIFPTIASLAATLLIIATFNDKVVPLTYDIKVALLWLLILIPVSLITYLIEIYDGLIAAGRAFERILLNREAEEDNLNPSILKNVSTHT